MTVMKNIVVIGVEGIVENNPAGMRIRVNRAEDGGFSLVRWVPGREHEGPPHNASHHFISEPQLAAFLRAMGWRVSWKQAG